MIKIAIDVDGTITQWPKQMAALLEAFPTAVILTGCATPNPEQADRLSLATSRIEQLRPLIGNVCLEHTIYVCVGRSTSDVAIQKADYCRENEIDLFIDDDPTYCDLVRRCSQRTAVLKVY